LLLLQSPELEICRVLEESSEKAITKQKQLYMILLTTFPTNQGEIIPLIT